ncbi:hypothetical protein AAVH_38602 [Aphelenchoides avenae]|nr:hypothetical protein AAVH_38602 [Aphelenchus avenae]
MPSLPLLFLFAALVAAGPSMFRTGTEDSPQKGFVNCDTGMNNLCPFSSWNCDQYCKNTYGQQSSGYCQGTYPYSNKCCCSY